MEHLPTTMSAFILIRFTLEGVFLPEQLRILPTYGMQTILPPEITGIIFFTMPVQEVQRVNIMQFVLQEQPV